jgi:hypothetical protein
MLSNVTPICPICKIHKLSLNYNFKNSYRKTCGKKDHIYSISDGFKNNINPKIIGCVCNLQLIPAKINLQKNHNSWISISDLISLYEQLSQEDKFLI